MPRTGAPAIAPSTPYFGFDVAQDIAYVPFGASGSYGDGVLVLDRFGGVHRGGAIPNSSANPRPPYFGFNIARAITYRNVPPRVAGVAGGGATLLNATSTTYTSLQSVTIDAPDDGFLLVSGSTTAYCLSNSGSVAFAATLSVDTTTADTASISYATFADCSVIVPGESSPLETVSRTRLFAVAAGQHTVHLLGRKAAGTQGVYAAFKSLTALFVDQNGVGGS